MTAGGKISLCQCLIYVTQPDNEYINYMNGVHEECRRQGIAFLPIVAETFGGWHPEAGREVKKLGPICGAEWVSCCSAAMLPYSGIGFQPYLEPILTGSFSPKITASN